MDIIMSQVNSLSTASKSQPPDRLTPIWRGAVRDALGAPPSLFACKDTTLFLSPQGVAMVLFLLPSPVFVGDGCPAAEIVLETISHILAVAHIALGANLVAHMLLHEDALPVVTVFPHRAPRFIFILIKISIFNMIKAIKGNNIAPKCFFPVHSFLYFSIIRISFPFVTRRKYNIKK